MALVTENSMSSGKVARNRFLLEKKLNITLTRYMAEKKSSNISLVV